MDEKKSRSKGVVREEKLCENLSFAAKEAFKRLRTNVVMKFPAEDSTCKIIGVTSAQPSEGKSTVSINLAYSLAELGKKVLLLDADMRRSSIHQKLHLEKTPGLSDLLGTANSISTAMRKYNSSKDSTSFDVIPGGNTPTNPSELLNSRRMETLLRALAKVYDYIVIDLPPVGAVIDAVSVSRQVDGMLLVIRENNCPRGLFADAVSQLQEANVDILGFVVNGAMEGAGKKYQYNNYYY
ncbi:MAG: CpsD/CapB family tyrosine-protein kinase [Oscillospiraceae bacterium]|nr:CpsD/CapB family tyrosine-protein kinase [Oscillospiraceae bacterium]